MAKYITTDDILGKEVLASDGDIIGIVQKLHIDATTKTITGITIDEGFMKPDLFIGLQFIKQFGIDSLFLSIIPEQKFIGLRVYNNKGKLVGTITDIETGKNNAKIKKIKVKSGFTTKDYSAKEIKMIGSSVLLK
jgi:sporulation protein YlmC with PRC-barrel domain